MPTSDKALSIQQPWAWAIVNGYKPVENRTWATKLRGRVQIHAGLRFDRAGYDWLTQNFPRIKWPAPAQFERGGIVGSVEITDCVTQSTSPYFFGPYGFTLTRPKRCRFRKCRGQLGFFRPKST